METTKATEYTRYFERHATDDGSSVCGWSGEAAGSDWKREPGGAAWAYCGECDQQVRVVASCEHCQRKDRTVALDRFNNMLCKGCAEAEAAAEDRGE